MKYKFLTADHPTYLRRLAKEINTHIDGVYYGGVRWTRARVCKDVYTPACATLYLYNSCGKVPVPMGTGINDAYGQEVIASKERRR